MDRRDFLSATLHKKQPEKITKPAAKPVQSSGERGVTINSGIDPFAGTWDRAAVVHLLKRTMFGATKDHVDYLVAKTPAQAVDELLVVPAALPPGPLKNYHNTYASNPAAYPNYTANTGGDPDFNVADGTSWTGAGYTQYTEPARLNTFRYWVTGLFINQQLSIQEKMYLFWHNHFSTETQDVGRGVHVYKHHSLLRQNSLGNFKTLVRAISVDPAMLYYLNGYVNTKTAPDENYGRELQELFTVGKENSPNYTEADVKAAARVLTGWQVNNGSATNPLVAATSYFTLSRHDIAAKQFSSTYYNNTSIAGVNSSNGGDIELDALINMIFTKADDVARYMVRRFYRWFCYYKIDATIEANVIIPLANIFKTNWEIKPVIAALLKSEHFFDAAMRGAMIKAPVDFVIGGLREFNFVMPVSQQTYLYQYPLWANFYNQMKSMGQDIGAPPNVAGWPAYYQIPQWHELWINADTYPKRKKHSDNMINPTINSGGYVVNSIRYKIDPVAFADKFGNDAGDPNLIIERALELMLSVPLSSQKKEKAKIEILLSNQTSDYYWTNAWTAWKNNPDQVANLSNYTIVYSRLATLFKYIMSLPEYQLM